MVNTEHIKELKERCEALYRYLEVEKLRIELENEEERTQEPDFWEDAEAARVQLQKVTILKSWLEDYDEVAKSVEELELIPEFIAAEVITEEELETLYERTKTATEALELRNMLRSEEDRLGAIIDINSGAGGTEALDWAAMLLRMYTRWAESKGFSVKMLDYQAGDEVGVKSATIEIDGAYAYGYLKGESGVHRMVRLSPFNAQNKRQTTFGGVFVVPLVDDEIAVEITLLI